MSLPEQFVEPDQLQSSREINGQRLAAAHAQHELVTHGMPSHIWVEPTNACNARCPLCPTGNGESERAKALLSPEVFRSVVDEVYPYTKSMNLWNIGEPFLNPHLFDMIRYAEDHDIATRVSTNGFVFYREENVERLIDSGLTNLVVSLDGTSADVFNIYRVNVDFEKIMNGLRLLQQAKIDRGATYPTAVWQFIAMSHNVHQIPEAKQLADELGMVFSLKTVNLDMVGERRENASFLPEQESLRRYELQDNKWKLRVDRDNDCSVLWRSIMVNADGTVVPCCYDFSSDLVVGHFPEQSIREIWDGEAMQRLRHTIVTDRMSLKPCSTCSVGARTAIFLDEGMVDV
ncbi:MAG: radical SAM protein [Candidatus Roizmanbacteria bacterium]|nr:radical SAM protein [Candidatus Roizmanbacteria bacterium]